MFLAICLIAFPALADFYARPGSEAEPPVLCDGCLGENPYGQPNDGLKTKPYVTPVAEHVGRLLDSTETLASGSLCLHTLRAETIRIARSTRGSSPPRLYMILGDVLTGWTLSDFVSDAAGSMSSVTALKKQLNMSHSVCRSTAEVFNGGFDGMFYPLSNNHTWSVAGLGDLNEHTLADFDFDDQGYLYAAYSGFGYGILKDNGSGFFSLIKQMTGISPSMTFALKTDTKRYAAIGTRQDLDLYDVTTRSAPKFEREIASVWAWAKNYDYASGRPLIAVISSDGKTVKIYTEENLAQGGSPETGGSFTATTGMSFQDLAFDDEGRLWAIEGSAAAKVADANLVQIRKEGSNWVRTNHPFPRTVFPRSVAAAGGYVAAQGKIGSGGREDLFLFKVANDDLDSLDTGAFFQKFYHYPDPDYAQPYKFFSQSEVALLKDGSNVYMVYNALGLSDVYRLGTSAAPVCDAPSAVEFTWSGPAGCTTSTDCPEDQGITFSATKNGSSLQSCDTVAWDFDNNGTTDSTSRTPTYTYTTPGTYSAKLTVTSGSTSLSRTKPVKIVAPPCDPITADSIEFTWDGPGTCAPGFDCPQGGVISFSGTRSGGAFQVCDTFAWDFNNDGVTDSTLEEPNKSFSTPGTYPVTLTVDNSETGPGVSRTRNVVVVESDGCTLAPNRINFTPTYKGLTSGCAQNNSVKCKRNETIEFNVSFTAYAPQACDQYRWEFEDGGTADVRKPTHVFTGTASSYDVTLRVFNEAGGDEETFTVDMEGGSTTTCTAPTGITFTYTGSKGCSNTKNCEAGETITFTPKRGSSALQSCDTAAWDFGDGDTAFRDADQTKTVTHKFTSSGSRTVQLTVDNNQGPPDTESKTLTIVPATSTGGCTSHAEEVNLSINYKGLTSGCRNTNETQCLPGETIEFGVSVAFYSLQSCDLWEWDFGGGVKAETRDATHVFASGATSYPVSVRLYNESGEGKKTINLPMTGVAVAPIPKLSYTTFPTTALTGQTVSFTAASDIAATNGWKWTFSDTGTSDSSQSGVTQPSSTISHTFTKTGTFTVKVEAKNAAEGVQPLTSLSKSITITAPPPEAKFVIPVVSHVGGADSPGQKWRTDVLIYTPDTTVSSLNPLALKVTFRGKDYPLEITTSTYISEDFLWQLLRPTPDDCQNEICFGPLFITTPSTKTPQIWSRTYVDTGNGTFGQFIPAERIDQEGGASAVGDGKYYLPGLKTDAKFRTNIGLVNPTGSPVDATLIFYSEGQAPHRTLTKQMTAFGFNQFRITNSGADSDSVIAVPGLPSEKPFTVQVIVPSGSKVIGYASVVDNLTDDPVFISAVKETELMSDDYDTMIVPGVSHFNQWRSELSLFNPDALPVNLDVEYFDMAGNRYPASGAARIPVTQALQIDDILKDGVLGGAVPDGSGFLKIKVVDEFITAHPFAFVRTYYDTVTNGTYGQSIAAFPVARANVKTGAPALIPAIRGGANYRTNLFLVNVGEAETRVRVSTLDPNTGLSLRSDEYPLAPNQTFLHGNFTAYLKDAGFDRDKATLKVEIAPGYAGTVWAYASVIDQKTSDPEYVQAFPLSQ